MAISYIGASAIGSGMPAHVANDLLIYVCPGGGWATVAGWTYLDGAISLSAEQMSVFYKKAASSSETRPAIGSAFGRVYNFRGVHTTTPFSATPNPVGVAGSGTVTVNSATSANPGSVPVLFGVTGDADAEGAGAYARVTAGGGPQVQTDTGEVIAGPAATSGAHRMWYGIPIKSGAATGTHTVTGGGNYDPYVGGVLVLLNDPTGVDPSPGTGKSVAVVC